MAEKKAGVNEAKLEDALLKVALGYQLAEVTEEYAEVNGELKLTKRKKTKKDVPPDLKAVQMLLSGSGGEEALGELTDEELEKEKQRLLTVLREAYDKAQGTGEAAKAKMRAKNEEIRAAACDGDKAQENVKTVVQVKEAGEAVAQADGKGVATAATGEALPQASVAPKKVVKRRTSVRKKAASKKTVKKKTVKKGE